LTAKNAEKPRRGRREELASRRAGREKRFEENYG
jgi:hypothetical protein